MEQQPSEIAPGAASDTSIKRKKKKKDKVRSAWISFAGRIVAQIVGAAATIALTLLFLQKYSDHKARIAPEAPATVRVEVVLEMPARSGEQADVAAAVARDVIAATQHAAAVNGAVALIRGGNASAGQ